MWTASNLTVLALIHSLNALQPDANVEQASSPAQEQAPVQADTKKALYPEIPILWRAELLLAYSRTRIPHQSYEHVDDDNARSGLEFELRLDHRLGKKFFLGGIASYIQTESDGYTSDLFSKLSMHEPQLGVRASFVPLEGIDLYLGLKGGPLIADLSYSWDSTNYFSEDGTAYVIKAQQRVITGSGQAMLGAMFYLPKQWLPRRGSSHLTTGIDLGIGYTLRGALDVNPERELDEDPIDTRGTSWGSVQTHGIAWRVGLFLRFI